MNDDYPTNIVTRTSGIQAIVGECVICGDEHYHGLGSRPPNSADLGTRSTHCKSPASESPGEYNLILGEDVRGEFGLDEPEQTDTYE